MIRDNKKIYNRTITNHAKERTLQRTEMNLTELKQASSFAFKHGYKVRNFSGEFYEYLNSKQLRGAHYKICVYEDYIYVFDTRLKRMLTIYPVPEEYLPISQWITDNTSPCIILVSVDGHWEYVCEGGFLTTDIAEATEFRTVQKAENYIKNNNYMSVMIKQGHEIKVMPL
jgi:hypothetical protein